jgi:biotin carboxylase
MAISGHAFILGGGRWQTDVIKRASDLGLRTLVADVSSAAPGRGIADEFVQIDTNNKLGLLEIARRYEIDLVIAEQTDRVVPIAAFINEQMGLKGIKQEVAHVFTNKYAMRNALAHSGVRMPWYSEISSLEEARKCASDRGYPVVLKPKRAQSSIGVFKISDDRDLRTHFEQTMAVSEDRRILIEEFISGTEITVEAFSLRGKCSVLAVSEKKHYPFHPCLAQRISYPPRFDETTMRRIVETAEKVVSTLGLKDGISHAEYRVHKGWPYLIEVAARGGGNRIASVITPHVSGVDVYELLIRSLLGEDVEMPALRRRSAVLEFFDFAPGRVKTVKGLELHFKPGDIVERPKDGRSRLGYCISLGESRDEVDDKVSKVRQLVQVECEAA